MRVCVNNGIQPYEVRWAGGGDNAAGYCALHSRSSSPYSAVCDMGYGHNTFSVTLDYTIRGRKDQNSDVFINCIISLSVHLIYLFS